MAIAACASADESNTDTAMPTSFESSDDEDISSSTTTSSTTTSSTTTTAPPPTPDEVLQQWKNGLALKQCPGEVSDALDPTVSNRFNEWCRAVVEFDEWLLSNDTRLQLDFPGSNLCDYEDGVELDNLQGLRGLLVRELQNDCLQIDLDFNAEEPERVLRATATNELPQVSYSASFTGDLTFPDFGSCATEGNLLTIGTTYFIYGTSVSGCPLNVEFTTAGKNPIPAFYPVTCPYETAVAGASASSCRTAEVDGGFLIGGDVWQSPDVADYFVVPGSVLDGAKFMIFGEIDEAVFVRDFVAFVDPPKECCMFSLTSDAIVPSWLLESYTGSGRIPSNVETVATQDCSSAEDPYVARFGRLIWDESTCTTLLWEDLASDSRMTDETLRSCVDNGWSIDSLVKGVFDTCVVTVFDVYQFDALTGACSFLAEIPRGPSSTSPNELVWIDGTTSSTAARCTIDPQLDNDDFGFGTFVASGVYEYENRLGGVNSVPRLIAMTAREIEDR